MKKRMIPLALVFFLLGCSLGKQVPQTSFIFQPPSFSISCTRKIPLTLAPFKADEPYDTPLMAYSPAPLELEFYAYHRWAAPLPDLVTQTVRESLKQWGCVTLVPFSHQVPLLKGRIIRFLHVIQGENSWGDVSIQFTLVQGNKLLAQKTFHARVKAPENTPRGGAQALNQALGEVIKNLLSWLNLEIPQITGEG